MKRICSATLAPEDIHPAFAELDMQAYDAGYNLITSGDSISNVEFNLVPMKNSEGMPQINVWLNKDESPNLYLDYRIIFPSIDSRDSRIDGQWLVRKFASLERFIGYLANFSIDLDMQYEE